jgi:hypothetical protein
MRALQELLALCRGETVISAELLRHSERRWWLICGVTIVVGCALFGFVIGWWRAPLQGLYTALKMPLLIFLTCGANALLNGLLAQVLGAGLTFRQSSLALLMSFTIAALVLAALSPVVVLLIGNAPPLSSQGNVAGHSTVLLSTVLFIAYAGAIAVRRLFGLLLAVCSTPAVARQLFWSWLAGNLFLGAQLSWVLRPFIGSPGLPVQFLRDDPMRGNFYESVGRALLHLLS